MTAGRVPFPADRWPGGLVLSAHARRVMAAREVEPEDLADALAAPDLTEPHEGRRRFIRGPLAVVVEESADGRRALVVTVLLRRRSTWTDSDARTRRAPLTPAADRRPATRTTDR